MKQPSALAGWWLDLAIGDKGLLVVALPLVVLTATGLLRVSLARQQDATTAILTQASLVRDTSQELLVALVELEAGAHGYVLTSDEAFLSPLQDAERAIPDALTRLSGMLTSDADQVVHQEIAALALKEVDIVKDIVGVMQSGRDTTDAILQQRLRAGEEVMSSLKRALGTLRRSYEGLVQEHQVELLRLQSRITPIIFTTFFGGLIGAIAAGWLFATGIAKRVNGLERNAEPAGARGAPGLRAIARERRDRQPRSRAAARLAAAPHTRTRAAKRQHRAAADRARAGTPQPRARSVQLLGFARSARAAAQHRRLRAGAARGLGRAARRSRARITSRASGTRRSAWAG